MLKLCGGKKMKILIVDDNETARRLLQLYLAEYGALITVNNGSKAIEAFSQAMDTNERFDLICLDYVMPEMSGIEVVKVIRGLEHKHGISQNDHVRIIMTSAVDQQSDILKAYANGCDSYMIRPDRKERLIKEMRNFGLLPQAAI